MTTAQIIDAALSDLRTLRTVAWPTAWEFGLDCGRPADTINGRAIAWCDDHRPEVAR